MQAGGPSWEVPLGRKDSRGASLSGSNNNIPAPNNTFQTILTKFKLQGLNIVDMVALSGNIGFFSGNHKFLHIITMHNAYKDGTKGGRGGVKLNIIF